MNGTPLQLTLRELRAHFRDPRTLGTLLVVVLVLGFAGPFGTFDMLAPLPRLAYWAATIGLTYAAGFFTSVLADHLWTRGHDKPFVLRVAMMTLPTSLVATLIVAVINVTAFGVDDFEPMGTLALFGQCLIVAAGISAVGLLYERPEAAAGPTPPGPPPVLERVPLPQRGRLLALIVEDHYVDIVTDRGKTLVLMRLADAMRETGDVAGLQIHRSHWVARDAVVRALRVDGKSLLELSNGMRLPVSRGFAAAVKEAGLA